MGGAGKTTLLQHLGQWWQTTGFVEQVFYFGYDERAWTRQQILHAIAKQLFSELEYVRDFQPLPPPAQQVMLSKKLRATRHLLILDNLESITGSHMAIQHTLPPEEQTALRSLLKDLSGGRTIVLLGSRSGEEWLSPETFGDNLYDLAGLDPEAASMLTDRILEKYGVTKYRKEEDLRHLIKLLDGFPLALEVVLANLAHQTPTEVLTALQAGAVNLNTGDSQERTKNILRCIDYSHSNLSLDAQALLVCLAPFTSIVDTDWLDGYTKLLRQQPTLTTLPFDRWQEVIQEAKNWGLLSTDPHIRGHFHIQPALPYFLRARLNAPEQLERRAAVETAFRELYDQVGNALCRLLDSKDPQEKRMGMILVRQEYENLMAALKLALNAQVSILNCHRVLASYLDATQDHPRGLDLEMSVLKYLETYPSDKLEGSIGVELVSVIDRLAHRQLDLKQYIEAETSYQKALSIWLKNTSHDGDTIKRRSASIYHQLGKVAQEQRKWEQAEQYYQQALQIKKEYNDRYSQTSSYHQLGRVAQEQRKWAQAEQYYQQALQIKIEYNDHYGQASTFHQLGMVAQDQRQWAQAEQYYQQALQIYVEYNDHYSQARTYGQLGIMAVEHSQWEQACKYLLQALKTFIEYQDDHYSGMALNNLALLWKVSGDASLPATIAPILNATSEEVEALLRKVIEDDAGETSD